MKKRVLFYITGVQIIVIIVVVFSIYSRSSSKINPKLINLEGKKNITASPSGVLRYFYEPIPGSITSNLGWMGKQFDYSVKYSITSDTLNQINEYPQKKTQNTYRIVALGDSFTFGSNVNTEDNYPSQLEEMLNKNCNRDLEYQVINLGVEGYGIEYAINRFRLRGIKYEPDLIIWNISGDDLLRLNELMIPKLQELNEGKKGKRKNNSEYYSNWKWARNKAIQQVGGEKKALDIQERLLITFDSYFKKKLVFTTFVNSPKTYVDLLKRVAKIRPNTYLYPEIRDISKLGVVFPDYHPTEEGYRMIAEDMFDFLNDNKIISCM